jgi:hypothetical protein
VCGKTEGQLEGKMLKCEKCLAAYYCSAGCFVPDKDKHALVCEQMAVEQAQRAAAAAVAKATARAAAKEAKEAAAAVAAARAKAGACAVCGKSKRGGNNSCSKCTAVYYCGRACQLVDWPKHKRVCKKAPAAAAAVDGGDKCRK